MTDAYNLVGEKKEFTIKGKTIYLKPIDLFGEDNGFDLLISMTEENGAKKDKALREIVEKTLKVSGVKADLSFGVALLSAVMDVNGLKEEEEDVVSASTKVSNKKEA